MRRFGPPNLIFKLESFAENRARLEFGPNVNLASISMNDILLLEMQAINYRDSWSLTFRRSVDGSPAAEFISPDTRGASHGVTGHVDSEVWTPKRTLQALSYLVEYREISDLSDLRRHKYTKMKKT